MTSHSRSGLSKRAALEFPINSGQGGLRLDHFLLDFTQKLDAIATLESRGETVDADSREWMASQVNFIVELIGNESLALDDDLRSKLLQMLLSIANLNERIRSQSSVSH
jgi:hypothetical protein